MTTYPIGETIPLEYMMNSVKLEDGEIFACTSIVYLNHDKEVLNQRRANCIYFERFSSVEKFKQKLWHSTSNIKISLDEEYLKIEFLGGDFYKEVYCKTENEGIYDGKIN